MNIRPNCLKVERATIFLASTSSNALNLATVKVKIPSPPHIKMLIEVKVLNRIISHTPAVTRVEL
jgi:hypothetical protein